MRTTYCMARVRLRQGTQPYLIIAPHGHADNDFNTDHLAVALANALDGYSVINHGWRRGEMPNYTDSIANCNNADHLLLDPVKTEFLSPILFFKEKIIQKHNRVHVLLIHGASEARKTSENPMDIVLGYGAGNPCFFSCDLIFKDQFAYRLQEQGFVVYQGKAGGPLSGWGYRNLNQLFRRRYVDTRVQSIQLEFVGSSRDTVQKARNVGILVGITLDYLLRFGYVDLPVNFSMGEI